MNIFWLESALRNGIVPLCCGGASFCFAAYGIRVQFAAITWNAIPLDNQHIRKQYNRHALILQQHAASVAGMSVISAATCREAYVDWKGYRGMASIGQIEEWLVRRHPPFFLRPLVLMVSAASLYGAHLATGRIRFWQPQQPVIIASNSGNGGNS